MLGKLTDSSFYPWKQTPQMNLFLISASMTLRIKRIRENGANDNFQFHFMITKRFMKLFHERLTMSL